MAIKKTIEIDGSEVPFKASAAVPRLYRLKFARDIYKDFASLQKNVQENDEGESTLDIESLEVFENVAYIMAKHADPENIPDNPDDFLEQFNTFSIYEILPQLIELWGLNIATQVKSKKHRQTDREMTIPLFLLRCKQLGLSMTELDLLTIGLINDMFTERENDDYDYPIKADQTAMNLF